MGGGHALSRHDKLLHHIILLLGHSHRCLLSSALEHLLDILLLVLRQTLNLLLLLRKLDRLSHLAIKLIGLLSCRCLRLIWVHRLTIA